MNIFESLFDVSYLVLVVAFGVRLLLEKKPGAKLFGLMAIILGAGDAFHLLPRVISHLSPAGFEGHIFALSWGKFVASITMTIFYLLYFHFYQNQSGDKDKRKTFLMYALAFLRIVIVLLPQNNWGTTLGNYAFGIYRNIPFTIMGLLLIVWTFQKKDVPALKHNYWLIFLSFLFYIPVVLFSQTVPIVGALMLPKTLAYLFLVIFGFQFFVPDFDAKNILSLSITFLIMGLVGGVFYREFTKAYQFTEITHLGKIHVHTLVLGFLTLFSMYQLVKNYDSEKITHLKKPLRIYIVGLTFTIINMIVIGIYEVVSLGQQIIVRAAIDGTSGIGHILLGVGLVWLLIRVLEYEKRNSTSKKINT